MKALTSTLFFELVFFNQIVHSFNITRHVAFSTPRIDDPSKGKENFSTVLTIIGSKEMVTTCKLKFEGIMIRSRPYIELELY